MKVIFLDVDGVLNGDHTSRRTNNGCIFVGTRQMRHLAQIVRETKAVAVISSDWRIDKDDISGSQDYQELLGELALYHIPVAGETPVLLSGHRGEEIDAWLQTHPTVKEFVILDDRSDIEPNKDHWVKTAASKGLTKEDVGEAIRILEPKGA